MTSPQPEFDAVLLLSFGGPEGPEDVMPFLENVTRGRNVPRARLEVVARQYLEFGGVSPINAINRRLLARLREKLASAGPRLPVYWGNRNWKPLLGDTMEEMTANGARRVLAFVTSAYSSYSSCRQYLEDIEAARAAVGERAPVVEKIRPYWNHPKFLRLFADNARRGLSTWGEPAPTPHLVFTAHSLPRHMADHCDYERQLREAAAWIAKDLGIGAWDLAFQSRSGPPSQPWLEPDINDYLRELATSGAKRVLLVPVGFVADHMEVKFDLDTQAAATAAAQGLDLKRVATPGDGEGFVDLVQDLILEHLEGRPPAVTGSLPACPTPCAPSCCRIPAEPSTRPAHSSAS